jgi:hypothetical protein
MSTIRQRDLIAAVADEVTDLVVGNTQLTFRSAQAMNITEVRANVSVAPAGAALDIDIKKNGVSIFSTTLTIDDGSTTSVGATIPPVLSTTTIADDDIITVDVLVVGSTTAGKGLKIAIIGY